MVTEKHQLARLQLAIMQVLWDREEASVSDVQEALRPERDLAYTTVGTMLAKMEGNGQVSHRNEGRINIYRSLLPREEVSQSMVADLTERLFHGDVSQLLCSLLDGSDVSAAELARLKKLIRQKEKELRDE